VPVQTFHPITEESFDNDMCEIATGGLTDERCTLSTMPGKFITIKFEIPDYVKRFLFK